MPASAVAIDAIVVVIAAPAAADIINAQGAVAAAQAEPGSASATIHTTMSLHQRVMSAM